MGGIYGYISPIVGVLGEPLAVVVGATLALILVLVAKRVATDFLGVKKPQSYDSLEQIVRQRFNNDRIVLDGKKFVECTFTRCTLEHKGGLFLIDGGYFCTNCSLQVSNPACMQLARLCMAVYSMQSYAPDLKIIAIDEHDRTIPISEPVYERKNEPEDIS